MRLHVQLFKPEEMNEMFTGMGRQHLTGCTAATMLLFANLVSAATITIQPTDSAGAWHFYYQGRDDGWDGGAGSASYYFDCCPAFRNYHYAYLGGTLPVLAPGVNVLSATLYVDVTGGANFGGGIGAARLYGVSNQTAGTFRALDGAAIGGAQVNVVVTSLGWQGFDVTSALQWDYAHNYSYAGFMFGAAGSGVGSSWFSFVPYSSAAQLNPYIVVQTDAPKTVPEPGTGRLLAGLLAGYLLLRRRPNRRLL